MDDYGDLYVVFQNLKSIPKESLKTTAMKSILKEK